MTPAFASAEWETLLTHLGYGNPSGRLWFLGMEERLMGDRDRNLRWRLDHFRHPVCDLTTHQRAFWVAGTVAKTPTWRMMSKMARLLLENAPDWSDRDKAIDYLLRRLGTANGDTFLAELLPLPAVNLKDWPYPDLFPGGRKQYERNVLPLRLRLLRDFAEEHRPDFIVCYGSQYWDYYRVVFPLERETVHRFPGEKSEVRLATGVWGRTRMALTPFFAPYIFPQKVLEQIPQLLSPGPRSLAP